LEVKRLPKLEFLMAFIAALNYDFEMSIVKGGLAAVYAV
jgi:hypothetical protein